jgi:hypothetical protein
MALGEQPLLCHEIDLASMRLNSTTVAPFAYLHTKTTKKRESRMKQRKTPKICSMKRGAYTCGKHIPEMP